MYFETQLSRLAWRARLIQGTLLHAHTCGWSLSVCVAMKRSNSFSRLTSSAYTQPNRSSIEAADYATDGALLAQTILLMRLL